VRRFPECSSDDVKRFLTARRDNLEHAASALAKHLAWRKDTLPVSRDEPLVAAELAKVGAHVRSASVLATASHHIVQ